MKHFVEIGNGLKAVKSFYKTLLLDVWQASEFTFKFVLTKFNNV